MIDNRRQNWVVISAITSLIIISCFIAIILPGDGVWNRNLNAGSDFLSGVLPSPPAYPIWGYSLFSQVMEEYTPVLQSILLYPLLFLLVRHTGQIAAGTKHPSIRGLMLVILLLPFIFLSTSLYTSSVAAILMISGTLLIIKGIRDEYRPGPLFTAGLLIGLAYNFRAEILIYGLAVAGCLLLYLARHGRFKTDCKGILVYVAVMLTCTIPWISYTASVLDRPSITSTNGGGTMYFGLGIREDNPWNIIDSDDFVENIADQLEFGSAWSEKANRHFKIEFMNAVQEHPRAFVDRIVTGWIYMMKQGLYFPDFRALHTSSQYRAELDYVNEVFKQNLGLNVNQEQLRKYKEMGISNNVISIGQYFIVVSEYFLRVVFALVFLALVIGSIYTSIVTRFRYIESYLFVAYSGILLAVAGLIQTNPRHTTLILPILIITCFTVRLRGQIAQTDANIKHTVATSKE